MNQISSIQDVSQTNVELEQQIIGAVLQDNGRYYKIGGLIEPVMFSDPVHQDIWRNIAGRIAKDHIASAVTLKADLEAHDGLKELGGAKYLANLAGASMSAFAVVDYARELRDLYGRRELLRHVQEARNGISGGLPTQDVVAGLETALSEREDMGLERRSMSLLTAQTEGLRSAHAAMESGNYGIPTGLAALDDLIGGLRPKETIVIAGATSMGKSLLGVWLSYQAAKHGFGVAFASLEMSEETLGFRFNSIESEIPYVAMQRKMSHATLQHVAEAAKRQQSLPIEILSSRVRDIPAILSETKRLRAAWPASGDFKGLGLLVIDYIQLVRGRGSNYEVLSQVARETKSIAKMMGIPVVALAQVARDMSKRDSKIPHLGDLRGAGDLEDAADNVIFCHRPVYYLERQEPPKDFDERADWEASIVASKNRMQLIVAKQRMGPLGTVEVGCDITTNRFWDLHKDGELDF